MTRMLAEMLDAEQPKFRILLQQLEQANGRPSADIRLTTYLIQRTKQKIKELGLDPGDTTSVELYEALKQRLLIDDTYLRKVLHLTLDSTSTEVFSAIQRFESELAIPRQAFGIKFSVIKRLLKNNPPKKTMTFLGYRSVDSMLKHEPVPQIYIAAQLYEPAQWQERLYESYKKLVPGDFEKRDIKVLYPQSPRWQTIAQEFASQNKHICRPVIELCSVVVLPVSINLPALSLITILLLLDAINTIRCSSSYLKLQQVKPSFSEDIVKLAQNEPITTVEIVGQKLPWRVLQHYYQSLRDKFLPENIVPHFQVEDLNIISSEATLSKQVPQLVFWNGTSNLIMIENGQPVSLNILDVAINAANNIPFQDRILDNVRKNIWTNLITRYLNPSNLEKLLQELVDSQINVPALESIEV